LDIEKIKACYGGEEGKKLLSESISASRAVGATGSPTMYIGGSQYNGGRDEAYFTRAICRNISGYAGCKGTAECAVDLECTADPAKDGVCEGGKCAYKEAPKIMVSILNDKQCADCGTTVVEDAIKQLFKGAEIKTIDISESEGKSLAQKFGLRAVPAYIFSSAVEKSSAWKSNERLKSAFEKLGDGSYKLSDSATGASHIIDKEYLAEVQKKLGLTAGKPQIDFFVMSYCPYGNQAEEIIYEVYKVLGAKAVFSPRYVIYSDYGNECLDNGNLCSMHGGQELNQDIREKCVLNSFGIKSWFDFAVAMNAKCTAQNADSCWRGVAKSLNLDAAKIFGCEKAEGIALMRNEKEINGMLGVGGSPSIFIDGAEYSGARDANSILNALCSKFKDAPAECGMQIASAGQAAPAGGCG
jgi:protein-disulfide isomerase